MRSVSLLQKTPEKGAQLVARRAQTHPKTERSKFAYRPITCSHRQLSQVHTLSLLICLAHCSQCRHPLRTVQKPSQLTVCVPLAWQSPRVRGRGVDQGRRADASWARLLSCPPSSTGSSNPTLLWASGLQRAALRSWRAARAPLFQQTASLARTSTRGRPRRRARVQRRLRRDTGGLRATLLLDARAVDSGPHYLCACEIVGRALARMHMHVRC